jgi:uncharacterized membrane protein YphA (DoxX/SURF4 family)
MTASRLLLGGVWLFAGASKVGDLAASGRAVHAYQLTPYEVSVVLGAALPVVELVLGALLVVGVATRVAGSVSALLLAGFMTGIGSAWARGLTIDCGCFGGGGELPAGTDPGYSVEIARDLGLLTLAFLIIIFPVTRYSVDARLVALTRREDQ